MNNVGTHFRPEALKFLRGLVRHNDREWFTARRSIYEQSLKAPMLALIEEINADMIHFAPDHVRAPAKTMMRIYRDTRFSNDKRPYKKQIAAWFGRRGAIRTTGPGFYLHVSATDVHMGAGVFMPLPEQLIAIRQWMAENHKRYQALVKRARGALKGGAKLEPASLNPLVRMPKGFAADHPADELLRARRWGILYSAPADTALESDFSASVIKILKASAPVVTALDEAIASSPVEAAKKRAKIMF